jgi:hypothetical protein
MKKLRYIAPGVVAVGAAGLVAVQAVPAQAATAKTEGCTSAKLCLWYSSGKGSAIWKTSATKVPNLGDYDFTDGTGSGAIVRNDAHSYNTSEYAYNMYSHVDYSGIVDYLSKDTPSGTYSADPLSSDMINNESSFSVNDGI